ncbi:MAG: hypothetical protein KDE23_28155, partial [Caldilinea sp.]|nr:hypothetical protein [Caldilinea sp.]
VLGGGAMYNGGSSGSSSPSLVNVTFSRNSAAAGGGGAMYNGGSSGVSSPSLVNVILWGNSAYSNVGTGLYNVSATPIISYTLVPSSTAAILNSSSTITWGPGNITDTAALTTTDIFVDAANGNLRLADFSPAIDAGNNGAIPIGVTTDLDGSTRLHDDRVVRDRGSGSPPLADMGAYERQTDSCPSKVLVYVDGDASGTNNG